MINRDKLSSAELWRHIHQLEGQTVYTLKTRQSNYIERVTENSVIIRNRKSQPSRLEIETIYDYAWRHGECRLYAMDWKGPPSKIYAVVPAIVLAAAPDQLEQIHDGGLTGIRLRGG